MEAFCLLVFLKFISYIETTKPKSLNLALETVLEFNNKDNSADLKFIDNVQQVLDKVKTALDTGMTARRYHPETKQMKFTEFVKSAIDILKTYDDDDLEDVFAVFDDEIRKYHYKGCKFYELVENQSVRRFVANKLDYVKDKPARLLRKNLNKVSEAIEDSKFSSGQTEFLDYINSLYRQDSSDKLRIFLNKLQTYSSKSKRANLNLIKVIRDGIRTVVFDHYSELNANARKDLKIKLETSWRDIKHPERINHKMWTLKYGLTKNDDKTFNYNNVLTFTNNKKQKFVTRTVTTKNTKGDDSSEMSDTEGYETHYKLNSKKLTKIKEQKMQHHKKLSSFITLYPEEITFNTKQKRFKVESTTQKSKLYTLWEEKIKHRESKDKKYEPSKPKPSKLRMKAELTNIISDADIIINVKRAGMSLEDDAPKMRHHQQYRKIKSSKTPYKWYKTKTTELNHKKTTNIKSRKHFPVDNTPLSEEGMSIEVYEIKRRSMKSDNNSDTSAQSELKLNVLRRINDLEKQMAEVKNKIDTKLTTAVDDNNLLMRETEFEPLEGTNTINNKTFSTTSMTKSSTESITQYNNTKSDITSKSNEILQIVSKNIQNQDIDSKHNEILKIDSNKIKTINKTSINNEILQNDANNNQKINVTSKSNEILPSHSENIRTDKIKTNNTTITKPDNIANTTEQSKNISIPEDENQRILVNVTEADLSEVGMDIDEDLDKDLEQFNLEDVTGPDGKLKPVDLV